MAGLTARQSEILAYIQESLSEEGYPPSQRDIAARFGFSQTAARDHLQALVRKGEIEIAVNDARGIRLLRQFAPKPVGLPLLGRIAAGAPLAAPEHAESWLNIEVVGDGEENDFSFGDAVLDNGMEVILTKRSEGYEIGMIWEGKSLMLGAYVPTLHYQTEKQVDDLLESAQLSLSSFLEKARLNKEMNRQLWTA